MNQIQSAKPRRFILVMGVSGSGKSTVGHALAEHLSLPFLEGDDFHPEANRARMAQGIALCDEDRWPWLDALGTAMAKAADDAGGVVASCSALRRIYRDHLRRATGDALVLVHVAGDHALLHARMAARSEHFMPTSLLDSQFATLECPAQDELCLTLDAGNPLDRNVAEATSFVTSAGGI